MDDALIQLAADIIDMRKYPLKKQGAQRYPAAAQQFAEAVEACSDFDTLRELVRMDTGHVLPPAIKQRVYEKLLAVEAERTPAMLRAYGMHLVMFGYTDADGSLIHDTDAMTDALYDEAAEKS